MITAASWRLPKGHERVAVFATLAEAQNWARMLVQADIMKLYRYYISTHRGAYEIVQQPA